MDGKTKAVVLWFGERVLTGGAQILNVDYAREHNKLAEGYTNERWYKRIDTDVLYDDFKKWAHHSYGPVFWSSLDMSKTGFMLVFYRVTGATRGRTRFGKQRPNTAYVAVFGPRNEHIAHYEQYCLEQSKAA